MTDKPKEGMRRRGFILGMLSASAMPKTLVTGATPALSALIESAGAQATAAVTQAASATTQSLLTEYFSHSAMRLSLGNVWLAAQLVIRDLSLPEEIDSLPSINKLVETLQHPSSTAHTSNLAQKYISPQQAVEQQLLRIKPNVAELKTSFEALKLEQPDVYKLYFGDASVDQAAERFSKAFTSGEEGLKQLKQEIKTYETQIYEHQLEILLKGEPIFTDMCSAHKIGGYPITDNFISKERLLIEDRTHSGEWSERIKPADEKAPFPLQR